MATKKVEDVVVEPVKEPGTALVSWRDKMMSAIQTTKEAEKPKGGFITLKGGRMTWNDEAFPGDKIRAVIIDYRFDNELYAEKYDSKKVAIPICYSVTRPGEEMAPSKESQTPQGWPEGETQGVFPGAACESCWAYQWQSADGGKGKGKACKTSRRLHILAADDVLKGPDAIAKADFLTMIPPASSIKNFQAVMNQITNALGAPMYGAVVEISVKPHDDFLFMVHFRVVEGITDDSLLEALTLKHEKVMEREIKFLLPDNGDDARTASSKY